ncbi:MAG: NAD(P)/FAD-dependent oxidoreductase [Acidilobaceae archaeon]
MKYDVVVIGGGHNGLVASCYLALHGLKVGLFESNSFLGGMASTPSLWSGFRVPVGAYVLSIFRSEIARDLGLFERGLKLIPKDPGMTIFLGRGRVLSSWSSLDKTVKEIEKISDRDARSYVEWSKLWGFIADILDYLYLNPPLNLSEVLDLASRALRLASHVRIGGFIEDIPRILVSPASRILNEFFESEEVKALLVEDAVVGELVAPSSIGSSLVLVHHYMGNITGVRGQWAYVAGGMGRLSEIIADRCRELGVDIHLNSRVEEIIVKNGRVLGVKVNGRIVESRFIISTIDARVALLKLVKWDEAELDKTIVRKLRSLKSIGASSKIIVATRSLPKLRREYEEFTDRIYRSSALTIDSVEYVENAYREAIVKGISSKPWISINTQSYLDPTVAPEGWHLISLFIQYTRYDEPSGWSEESRRRLIDYTFNVLGEYFEDFSVKAEKLLVLTPKDYEVMFNAPGGHIFHLSMSLDQVWAYRPILELSKYRTPIRGLYLGGSSSHPGGGVTGAPGYLSARSLLEDLGILKPRRVSLPSLILGFLKRRFRF